MANVLVVAELAGDCKLKKSTLSAITFARQALPAVGGAIHILVLGASTSGAAAELAAYGAAKIICVEDASLAKYTAEHYGPSVAAAAQGVSLVVATASSFGKDLLPRVAARLDAAYAGDCSGVAADRARADSNAFRASAPARSRHLLSRSPAGRPSGLRAGLGLPAPRLQTTAVVS